MQSPDVVVIDYGTGNLLSIRRGFEHLAMRVEVTSDPEALVAAPRVVLPGVGAFGLAMDELRRRGLDAVVREIASRGTPLFGVCLGMQMLLDESEEFGLTRGLGIIPGRVIPVPPETRGGLSRKIPHIGWNRLVRSREGSDWEGTPLRHVAEEDSVYFVHSFMAVPDDPSHRIADCLYEGDPIPAAIARENVFGCQFHPEKSGEVGLKILKGFLEL